MKYLIFDSGSLINFTSNGLLHLFTQLREAFKGEFLITHSIRYETIEHPMRVKRFEWGALRIKQLLDRGIIKIAEGKVVKADELKKRTNQILSTANNTFFARGKAIHLIEEGESECLALSELLSEKGIENLIVIDERTARLLCERPNNLERLFRKKLHTKIKSIKSNYGAFSKFRIIRSTELAYIAYKRGFTRLKDPRTLDAILYALKFGGVSISDREIKAIKKLKSR